MPRATALATRIAGNRGEAEEIVQETFLKTWLKAPDWLSSDAEIRGASFNTWFTRVLVNQSIDRRRRPSSAPLEAAAEIESQEPGGFDVTLRGETATRVAAAVAVLPARQRAALTLCHWDGMTNIEAAQALEITVGALESLLVRARQALRTALIDLAPDGAAAPAVRSAAVGGGKIQ